jgi:hypothetical protein
MISKWGLLRGYVSLGRHCNPSRKLTLFTGRGKEHVISNKNDAKKSAGNQMLAGTDYL